MSAAGAYLCTTQKSIGEKPLVSICIPTYNRPRELAAAVGSCLRQTYSNIEIIITDNSENGTSQVVIDQFKDKRIQYYRNGSNIGPTASTHRGLNMARGKYIKILMDDDLLTANSIGRMVAELERFPSCGVACAPMYFINEYGDAIQPRMYGLRRSALRYKSDLSCDHVMTSGYVLDQFLTKDYPCCVPSGVLFRAEALRPALPFDDSCDFCCDLDMLMRLSINWDFYYISEPLSYWRYTPNCHTARLHRDGMNVGVFYEVSNVVMNLAKRAGKHVPSWESAMFFCTCRSLALNGKAAIKGRNLSLAVRTISLVKKNDPWFWGHLFRFPLWMIRKLFTH